MTESQLLLEKLVPWCSKGKEELKQQIIPGRLCLASQVSLPAAQSGIFNAPFSSEVNFEVTSLALGHLTTHSSFII